MYVRSRQSGSGNCDEASGIFDPGYHRHSRYLVAVRLIMAKYSKGAQKKVEKTMHEYKRGKLKSGRSGKKVKSRKQAIAIGLSQARREGKKVPARSR